ncbi:NFACT RNA binding domain-containing protein [Sulfurospirillum arcachonense]|uniref:NFACT RNA binding domain-containing protein n=1 Tax=Sulfurospirillum arcachonense TaxID=57666 RepID=UPI000469DBC6|nr:NFACT RNA binding domain-containing protein [Sulfurospirillum arcachonense]
MKRNELIQVTQYLKKFKAVSSIGRVDDSIIKIVFDKGEVLFFDMKRGDSHIFKKDEYRRAKVYNAPFDVVLYKRFNRSSIISLDVSEGNRILRMSVNSNSSYKAQTTTLQFEFTGRNTNAIVLDDNDIVLEALRHIDSSVSYRSIKVGEHLEELPVREFEEKPSNIGEDIEVYLHNEYTKRAQIKLNQIKNQRLILLQKKIDKLQKLLNKLDNEEELLAKSEKLNFWGTLVLSNLHLVKAYQQEIELKDFEGNLVKIVVPKEARTPSEIGNILFDSSKKLKRKAKSLYKERENLNEKIDFYKKMQSAIESASDESEINILLPRQRHSKKTKKLQVSYESFFIEGFKVMLGKNEKGNIELLKEAKKRDIWLHIKDIPSSHVIIRTDKDTVPQSVLNFAAKLCVDFSVTSKSSYLVDYTQRRNVKIRDGANVNYVDYKTLHVDKD